MNLKNKTLLLLLLVSILSCKEEEKEVGEKTVETEKKETEVKATNHLVFEADLKTSKPDVFSLYANDVFINNNQFMDIKVEQRLNSNETTKRLYFKFPENLKPDYQLYLNLGTKVEKDVMFENMSLSYGNTKFDIPADNIMAYFTTNKYVEYDPESQTFKIRKAGNQLNPLLFFRKKILDSLQRL